MDRMEFAAMRPLDDFLLQSARFQLPNFKDPGRWGHRVTNNLLYYQTNYFFTALVVFLLVGSVSFTCATDRCPVASDTVREGFTSPKVH